ncbi:MAG: hypothetical protein JKY42_03055 [Flavobacteriales bacterium]|nr:hypothetical protein [Flavobacteriales bacterium]
MKYKTLLAAALIIFMAGCVKDSFNLNKLKKTTYNPTVAAPLVFTTLSLEQMLKQNESDLIHVDQDGFIRLIYRSSLFSSTAEDLISIPDQNYNQTVLPGIGPITLPAGNTQTYSETQTMLFAAAPNQLDSIILKGGTLGIISTSGFDATLDIVMTIPGATIAGVPFSQTISIAPNSNTISSFSLAGYKFDLTNGGTTTNEFQVVFDLTLTGNGNVINTTDQLDIDLTISNMLFSKLFGVIDISNIAPQEDTVAITLFNAASGIGDFTIVDPQVRLYTENSFGTTIEATFNKMEGINTISGTTYDLSTSGSLPSPWSITGPTYSQMGQTITDSLIITGTDVVDMINDQPKYFVYDIGASTPAAASQIFVLDTSKIKFDAEIELPMHGTIKNFTMIDTVGLDLGLDNVVSLTLTTRIRNGFPLEFDITFYALEWDTINFVYNLTDSAYTGGNILIAESGVLDGNGRVTSKLETETDIILDEFQTRNFANAGRMIIKAVASTTNNGTTNVKFYSDYELEFKIGAIAEILTEF